MSANLTVVVVGVVLLSAAGRAGAAPPKFC
jgi:hypothetical protein